MISRIARMVLVLQATLVTILLSQAAGPTVGDTIWLSRTVPVPPGNVVRAADWDPADPIELLGRPRISITGDSAEISYPVVVWRPGQHVVELPGPLLLGPGGTVDSLAGQQVRLQVRSVLPPVPPDSVLQPQPRASLVARDEVSPVPLMILWLLALVLLVPLHLWWRRRGKPPTASTPVVEVPEVPLSRWADAGESRSVINVAALHLRAALAERVAAAHPGLDTEHLLVELATARPDWPLQELRDVLQALDDARFGLIPSSDAMELSRSTLDLRDRLLQEAA
jgi:hypothetical protein